MIIELCLIYIYSNLYLNLTYLYFYVCRLLVSEDIEGFN